MAVARNALQILIDILAAYQPSYLIKRGKQQITHTTNLQDETQSGDVGSSLLVVNGWSVVVI